MAEAPEDKIIHREIDTDAKEPGVKLAETVADIEGKDTNELSAIYERVDGVLNKIFSNPPSSEAQLEIQFSYESYRITVEQNGNMRLVRIE